MFNLREEYQERIDNAMYTFYNEAITEIKRIVPEKYAHDIGSLIAWGYHQNDQSAENLFNALNIDEIHLAALLDDEEWLNNELQKEDDRNYLNTMDNYDVY